MTEEEYYKFGKMEGELLNLILPHFTPKLEEEIRNDIYYYFNHFNDENEKIIKITPEEVIREVTIIKKEEFFQEIAKLLMKIFSEQDYNKFEQIVRILKEKPKINPERAL